MRAMTMRQSGSRHLKRGEQVSHHPPASARQGSGRDVRALRVKLSGSCVGIGAEPGWRLVSGFVH